MSNHAVATDQVARLHWRYPWLALLQRKQFRAKFIFNGCHLCQRAANPKSVSCAPIRVIDQWEIEIVSLPNASVHFAVQPVEDS